MGLFGGRPFQVPEAFRLKDATVSIVEIKWKLESL